MSKNNKRVGDREKPVFHGFRDSVQESIGRPDTGINVLFRHESSDVEYQIGETQPPRQERHRSRHMSARMNHINAMLHDQAGGDQVPQQNIVDGRRQGWELVITKRDPTDSLLREPFAPLLTFS